MVAQHQNWTALREAETARMLAACTRCGECFRACPMIAHAPAAQGADGATIMGGVLDLLQGGAGDAASRAWTSACTRSGVCVPACPEAVNPMLMLRLAKFRAQESGALPPRDARDAMARVKTFARLTMTEEEWERWQ